MQLLGLLLGQLLGVVAGLSLGVVAGLSVNGCVAWIVGRSEDGCIAWKDGCMMSWMFGRNFVIQRFFGDRGDRRARGECC